VKTTLTLGVIVLSTCAALAGGVAGAGTLATSTVTIKAENGDFSGVLKSSRPRVCARDRKVIVFKQLGQEQDPSVDDKVASDTASRSGDRYEWSTGNTGVFGKVYSLVRRTPECKPDASKTVRSVHST
jgi:hypothetical protein